VHGIIMLLMNLHIFAKFGLNALAVVNFHSSSQLSGVDVSGDSIFWWEDV
jgi:hypothetical protein